MKKLSLLAASLLLTGQSFAGHPFNGHLNKVAFVSNGDDSGTGSLRDALTSGAEKIIIANHVESIDILSTLTYAGNSLKLVGSFQTISGDTGDQPLLEITNGANLEIRNLTFAGMGGFSIENQGGGKGIFVKVPVEQQDDVYVDLKDVIIRDTGYHGLHISDCTTGDDCGAGQGGLGDGSIASIFVTAKNLTIDNAGFGRQDGDGLRVDDRDEGDIFFQISNSVFSNVGGDGIELDEGGAGTVFVDMHHVTFHDNGAYCSADFVADPLALDPACDDDGDPDVDDAFDIDEAGNGGIAGRISNITLINNYDEGLDFDSEGTGDNNFIDLRISRVFARDNDDEAIKVSEEEAASVKVVMNHLDIGGDVEVEEEGEGSLKVIVKNSRIGDDLKLAQSDEGKGAVKLIKTIVVDEKKYEGVDEL